MKWIGQHIWSFISRFRSDVYLENLSSSSETDILVVDSAGKITTNSSAGGGGAASTVTVADESSDTTCFPLFVTAATGDLAPKTDSTLIYNSSSSELSSGTINSVGVISCGSLSSSGVGVFVGTLTTTYDANNAVGPIFNLTKTRGGSIAAANDDELGEIRFNGENDTGTETVVYAQIRSTISEADDTDEAGKLVLNVAASNGTTSSLNPGLILEGEHATGNEVDVTIGNGAASTTTVAGNLITTEDLNSNNLILLDTVDNTSNSSTIYFQKDTGANAVDNQAVGTIYYTGENDIQETITYASTLGQVSDASDGAEKGLYAIGVRSGGTVVSGLTMMGGDTGSEVDISIGSGSTSATVIAGDLTVNGGDINGPTDGSLTIKAETDLIFQIDSDTGGAETFQFKSGDGTEIANLDESGNLQIDGTITAKQREMYHQNFASKIGTTKRYIPFKTTTYQTSPHVDEACFLAPCDGRIVSVTVRAFTLTGTGDVTVDIHTIGLNTSSAGTFTVEEAKVHTMNTADDNHAFHYLFDNAKHFEAGELVGIGIQADSAVDTYPAVSYWYCTTVVEYDWNNQGLTSHAEYDSAP